MFGFLRTKQPSKLYRIGVDVGGTNTDAALLSSTAGSNTASADVVASCKTQTTHAVTDGIEAAVKNVLESSQIDPRAVAVVTIGTTHFLNAVLEKDAQKLEAVAVLRLSSGYTRELPPFTDFPESLGRIMNGYYAFCRGGCNIDGSEADSIDVQEIQNQALHIKSLGLSTIVLTGLYSPVQEKNKQEEAAKRAILAVYPEASVVCSYEVGTVGLLERENAAILNASILRFARRTIADFTSSLLHLKLHCPLYLTQNTGTIISAALARRLPIKTFSSGATNSMRGAAFLYRDKLTCPTIVLDVGGTTCDGGVLLPSGLPREASAYTILAGIRVNYPMPLLKSIALGGGSIVHDTDQGVCIGPDSVGPDISHRSLAFGGDVLTTTDIAVSSGLCTIGDAKLVLDLDRRLVMKAEAEIRKLLEVLIHDLKTCAGPAIVLLVGGGSMIVPSQLNGVNKIVRPKHHDVANAVGAAIAQVSGSVDKMVQASSAGLADMVEAARKEAIALCVTNGANALSVTIADQQVVPVQYTQQVRILVTAVGDLLLDATALNHSIENEQTSSDEPHVVAAGVHQVLPLMNKFVPRQDEVFNLEQYRPQINKERQWILSELDLDFLAKGCYVLGCAGGGSPYAEYLQLRGMLRQGHILRVAEVDSVSSTSLVLYGGHMGSPAVSIERLSANEFLDAATELSNYLNDQKYSAVMGLEIGGGNGLQPLLVGSSKHLDLPYLDADWMGRAYPTYYQTTLCIHVKDALVPAAIASGNGNAMIMTKANNDEIVDVALRAACTEMGSRVGMAARPITGDVVQRYAVHNTVSLAWRIGRVIATCQRSGTVGHIAERIIEEVGGPKTAKKLFCGRISEVESNHVRGHSYGSITVAPTNDESNMVPDPAPQWIDGLLRLPYKNEIILAEHEDTTGHKQVLASVPDLICVLDAGNGEALGVPEFRYGLRVIVLAITANPQWTETEAGLALGGPAAFGYDQVSYRPVGVYVKPRSVIEEYAHS